MYVCVRNNGCIRAIAGKGIASSLHLGNSDAVDLCVGGEQQQY